MTQHTANVFVVYFLFVSSLVLSLQSFSQTTESSPNDGYVSADVYANKFFDFSYTVPQNLIAQK